MPNGDPRDGFFYPTLTFMINPSIMQDMSKHEWAMLALHMRHTISVVDEKNVEIPHVVDVKMSNFKNKKKIYEKKNISKLHKIGGAHIQCVKIQSASFE